MKISIKLILILLKGYILILNIIMDLIIQIFDGLREIFKEEEE
jgi:hypothetical protein